MALFARKHTDYVIVGLGNPSAEYEDTRHNAGFMCIDVLADRLGANYWKSQGGALAATVSHGGHDLVLAKPHTFMNLSGSAVKSLAKTYSVAPRDIIVIHDEMDLEPGDVRVKRGGNHAGHNGIKSIYDQMASKDMVRVRIGIGRPPGRMEGADYVLQRLKGDKLEGQGVDCQIAADAVLSLVDDGLEATAQHFNGMHHQED